MELGLRHLQVVVAVAEAGSISRAAAELRIAQSGLTAQLGRIERELGAPLFIRRPHGVEPTELGTHVLLGARVLIAGFDDLIASARTRAHSGGSGTAVRLGGVDSPWISTVAAALRGLLPDHEQVTYVEENSDSVVDLVRTARLDLAVITEYPDAPAPRPHRLVVRDLGVEPLLVGLHADHPEAGRDRLRLAHLADYDWIAPTDKAGGLRHSLRTACERAGFAPRFRHFGADHGTAATIVGSGTTVGLFPTTTGPVPGVVFRHLTDEPLWCRTMLVWQQGSPLAAIAAELVTSASDERFRTRRPVTPFHVVDYRRAM
ncbi:LysR substrate-binding domain-containing protein [Umezawaea endophytica]|uniref:LysR family transcriptional regulator n=1 Tax=Umezawaea endophytica TaxID=1654476 RepID=A0A9X2VR76_9PSEU|nr:LysR family transcriptional regulator [Umezawaea endophytica]MCS7480023.1 LysR family transcriptional regulator [Umezawaea endophytica]